MNAYKFLAKGGLGPISGFAWPAPTSDAPGAWVEVDGALALCTRGVHVCRAGDLAHWLHEELWAVETDGDELEGLDCIVVRRARLLRRVDAWSDGGASRFAAASVAHATALAGSAPDDLVRGYIEDATLAMREGYLAISAYSAALAVAKLSASDSERAYRGERAWQAAWIARELIAGG